MVRFRKGRKGFTAEQLDIAWDRQAHITAMVIEATIVRRIFSSCAKGVITCVITTNQEFHGNLGYAGFCM